MIGKKRFIGSDDMLACFERRLDQRARGTIFTADQLDDDVGVAFRE
jgi:hypothetical protein